jgi:predicted nucleotidyltransferase component of viral defense system
MRPPTTPIDIAAWVEAAPDGQGEFREAVHTILCAIAHEPALRREMVMKGGILLAIRYGSNRFTKDIDFSTSKLLKDMPLETVRDLLDRSLVIAVAELDYDLDCQVQSATVMPSDKPGVTFPNIRLTIGHAYKGTAKHNALLGKRCPSIISIDFSLNEPILALEKLALGGSGDGILLSYAFSDLVAEKLRAILQQEQRNRVRRQDIYDLSRLLDRHAPDESERAAILSSLRKKSASRALEVSRDSMDNPEIRKRAQADYPQLANEIEGELPDFDASYNRVADFYRALPW